MSSLWTCFSSSVLSVRPPVSHRAARCGHASPALCHVSEAPRVTQGSSFLTAVHCSVDESPHSSVTADYVGSFHCGAITNTVTRNTPAHVLWQTHVRTSPGGASRGATAGSQGGQMPRVSRHCQSFPKVFFQLTPPKSIHHSSGCPTPLPSIGPVISSALLVGS